MIPLGIVASIVTARVLGPEVKGLFTLFLTTQGLILLPSTAVGLALIHFVANKQPDTGKLKKVVSFMVLGQALGMVGLFALLMQVAEIKKILLGDLGFAYLLPLFVIVCSNLWITYRLSILSGLQQYSKHVIWGTIGSLINSIASIVLLSVWAFVGAHPKVWWMVGVLVFSTLLSASVLGVATSRITAGSGANLPTKTILFALGAFAGPLLLRGLVEWVTLRVDVYFVHAFSGARELGVYTVAVGLSQQLWLMPLAISGPLFAKVSNQGDSEASRDMIRFAFRASWLVSIALGVGLAIAAPLVLPLTYGPQYSGSVLLLLILLPGAVALGPTRVLISYFSGRGRPIESLRAEVFGLIVTVVLNALLIPRLGAVGAACASCAAYLLYSMYICKRFVNLSESRWLDVLIPRPSDVSRLWGALSEQRKSFAKSPGTAWLFSLLRAKRA